MAFAIWLVKYTIATFKVQANFLIFMQRYLYLCKTFFRLLLNFFPISSQTESAPLSLNAKDRFRSRLSTEKILYSAFWRFQLSKTGLLFHSKKYANSSKKCANSIQNDKILFFLKYTTEFFRFFQFVPFDYKATVLPVDFTIFSSWPLYWQLTHFYFTLCIYFRENKSQLFVFLITVSIIPITVGFIEHTNLKKFFNFF